MHPFTTQVPTMKQEEESARITVVRWDTPFEILQGTYTRQRFAPHLHETFSLGAIEVGASMIRYRGRAVTQHAGDVVVIPAREVHTGEAASPAGWSYRMLYLPLDLIENFVSLDHFVFEGPSVADRDLAARVVALHRALEAGVEPLRGQTAMADVLHLLQERHASGAARSVPESQRAASVSCVRDYLEEHFAKTVTLTELAALSGVSPFHLSRQFRARYGLPPYMYLELVRVNRAREMLQRGDPISRIAFATGFSDQSHLTRRFKRVVGVPPGQYAKTYGTQRAGTHRVGMPRVA
ncbi:MAG TPA: AraC family transcriptional regulator [Gemmatimonadaceae bacterium]|nr:AraC family transcriptional regulator [Gemmatimonadaceae bacterium]